MLDNLVQPLESVTHHARGEPTFTRGSGFVVGRYFVTATVHLARNSHSISYVSGAPLWQGVHYPQFRVSVLALPDRACDDLCSDEAVTLNPQPRDGQPVVWMEKTLGRTALTHAHIMGSVEGGTSAEVGCSRSQWITVDQPFPPEILGAPVVGSHDGAVLGVAVENLQSPEGAFGIVVPFGCLLEKPNSLSRHPPGFALLTNP